MIDFNKYGDEYAYTDFESFKEQVNKFVGDHKMLITDSESDFVTLTGGNDYWKSFYSLNLNVLQAVFVESRIKEKDFEDILSRKLTQ